MGMTASKRKKMENLIYSVFTALDPTGINTEKYKKMFKGMSDKQFDIFFKDLFKNENRYLILDTVDYENSLKIDYAENAAKILNVPLFEKITMPYINHDKKNPIVSKYAVPVGYLHMKRMQQILSKKNSTSTNIDMRSALTGQVTGKDKNARDSDQENFALVTMEANENLKEFLGPRSDDMVMKGEMYNKIAKDGYVSLNDLPNNPENKTSLNTIDVFFIAMGFKTNLVTEGLLLKKSLK